MGVWIDDEGIETLTDPDTGDIIGVEPADQGETVEDES